MTPTEQYIAALSELRNGDLGLLRSHAGQGLDNSVDGFDLFAGLWWPLRAKNERAPRREVAWLIAKLYAFCPIHHSPDDYLACQLARYKPIKEPARQRFQERFDRLLILPLADVEPALQWALDWLCSNNARLDWVRLTDDLSMWDREATRLKWAYQYLNFSERR